MPRTSLPAAALQTILENLGAEEPEAEVIARALSRLADRASRADPGQAAQSLEAIADIFAAMARTTVREPRASGEIERVFHRLMMEDGGEAGEEKETLTFSPTMYRVLMLMHAKKRGVLTEDETDFFPFRAEDIAKIHTVNKGARGRWYLLHDGRLFDAEGRPAEGGTPGQHSRRIN